VAGLEIAPTKTRRAFNFGIAAAGTSAAIAPVLAYAQANPAVDAAVPLPSNGWQKLSTEDFRGKQDDISFVNQNIGWYGNGLGKLFQTTDGGNTWLLKANMPGTFIRALGFVDENVGYLGNVGTDYYPDVKDPYPLYKTGDGGSTWSKVAVDGIEKVKGICGIHILSRQRIFQGNMQNVPIIHAAGRVGGPAYIIRSIDGGRNWTILDLTAQAKFILDVHFLDEMNGLVCSNVEMTNAPPTKDGEQPTEAQMLRTADGGKTWTSVYRSGRATENCWKMSFPTNQVGYATVQSYDQDPKASQRVVIKTTDGGRTWKELNLVNDIKSREFGIAFISETQGWVGTATSGFETRDGGLTWSAFNFGRFVNKIRVVKPMDAHQSANQPKARVFAIGVNVHRLDV
jgi:photosystem II stability/assembly factor-like uncharacterized protein